MPNDVRNTVRFFDQAQLESLRRRHRLDPSVIRRLRNNLCKQFRDDDVAIVDFPAAEELEIHTLHVHQRCDSKLDGATKLLLRTEQGMLIESVILRIATGRTTLCVSSQVGCAAACDFCATGKMGVAQNLSAEQILDQVLLAGQILAREDRRLRNLVFMGMGEPFHNPDGLYETLRVLTSSEYFHHSPGRILVSSVGVADEMVRCAERFPEVGQALSLHSVRQSVREELIPLAKRFPLEQLRASLAKLNQIQSGPVMIEYLMLSGTNDSTTDAHELIEWLRSLNVHVNLIPYNPIDESNLVGSDPAKIQEFALILKKAGLKTTTRYSLGGDIAAACGQLVQQENRRIAQALAKGESSRFAPKL